MGGLTERRNNEHDSLYEESIKKPSMLLSAADYKMYLDKKLKWSMSRQDEVFKISSRKDY